MFAGSLTTLSVLLKPDEEKPSCLGSIKNNPLQPVQLQPNVINPLQLQANSGKKMQIATCSTHLSLEIINSSDLVVRC